MNELIESNCDINKMKKEKILEIIQAQKEVLEKEYGYKVAYICLYGSQNYNLDIHTEEYESDIDLKAVIVPALNDLVYNCKPVSTKYTYEYGEIDVKDIRVYMDTLIKANPAYIETLYTNYYIIDDEFKEEINSIFALRDKLVETLKCQFIRAIYGMMLEKQNAMCHPYPTIAWKIEKYGYDGKQTSHCIRLYYLMKNYFVDGMSLEECFVPNDHVKRNILEHKLNKVSLEAALRETKEYVYKAEEIKNSIVNCIDQNSIDYSVKKVILSISREIIKNNIVTKIKNDGGLLYD